jgi:arylsulfatase A-like enzyme
VSWLGAPAWLADDGAARVEDELAQMLEEEVGEDDRAFVFVNLLEPHWRYLPPLYARLGAAGGPLELLRATAFGMRFYGPPAMAGAPLPAGGTDALRALYAAEVRHQDAALGRLLAAVDARLGLDRTLVLVTADHGENLGEAGRYDHVFAVNDHLVHVPLVARGPGFAAGRREPGLCVLHDVPATLGDLVEGVEIPPARGRTLVPGRFAPREVVIAEGDPFYGHLERMSLAAGLRRDVARFTDVLRSARDARYKWVWSSRDGGALYDTVADPDETRDVQARHPERAGELAAALEAWEVATPAYTGVPAEDAGGAGLDEAERRRLEALGYVQ